MSGGVSDGRASGPPDGLPGGIPDGLPGAEWALDAVAPLAARFSAQGFRLYLVGGVVRDLAVAHQRRMTLPAFDIDLTTDARPPDIKRLVGPLADELWSQGERFGTIGARIGQHALEITTHRAEAYNPESRNPEVSFGDRLEDDLARRDFTINAAAIEVPSGQMHDPFGGLADLEARILRTPLSPEVSFTDDPLRMLRAARFIPRFNLVPDPGLVAAAQALADRLRIVSVERVADELNRLLALDNPESGWEFLLDTGLFGQALPGFAALPTVLDEPDPSQLAAELASGSGPGHRGALEVRRAGLLWPLGPEGADRELARLHASRADRATTGAIIGGAAAVLALAAPIGPVDVRRLAAAHGAERLADIAALVTNLGLVWPDLAPPALGDEFLAQVDRVAETEDLADLTSPLSGGDIMRLLGVEPGPIVGEATNFLRQLRIEHGPLSVAVAQENLLTWWKQRL
jgi:poly(A) polymerase